MKKLTYEYTNIGSFEKSSFKGYMEIDGKRIHIKVVPNREKGTEFIIRAMRRDLLGAGFFYPGSDHDREQLKMINLEGLKVI